MLAHQMTTMLLGLARAHPNATRTGDHPPATGRFHQPALEASPNWLRRQAILDTAEIVYARDEASNGA